MNYKKIKKIILITCMMFVFLLMNCVSVEAASFSVSSNASSVSSGKTFQVSISVSGAGKFGISVSNGSVSTNQIFVDGSASFSVTAAQSGKTVVTVSAQDVTGYDETVVTGSKSVSVSISSSSSGGTGGSSSNTDGGTTKPTVDNRSKENRLSSLNVSVGELSPKFSSDTTTYKVQLTSETSSIKVDAKSKDTKAKISGTGNHDLNIGENNIVVTVKAENGAKKTYTISVYVTEKPTVYLDFNNQKLGVLNDYSNIDFPKGFQKTTLTIDGKEVSSLKNDTLNITLLHMQNDAQQNGFYIIENGKIIDEFKTLTLNGKTYVILTTTDELKIIEMLKSSKVKIGDLEFDGWKYTDESLKNYSFIYLMNDKGEKNLYSYESTEETLQKYTQSVSQTASSMDTMTYIFIATTAVFAISTGGVLIMYYRFKKKSISAIKAYYERKSRD